MSYVRPLVVVVGVIGALLTPSPSSAETFYVRLEPMNGTSLAQGMPLEYRTQISNALPTQQRVTVTFSMVKVGSGTAPMAFRTWTGTVGPTSTLYVEDEVVAAQWFADMGTYEITANGADSPLRFNVTSPPVTVPRFQDVTGQAGLMTQHMADVLCDNYSAGAAWGDVDGDGALDLYLPRQTASAQLWMNRSGMFTERAVFAGADNPGRAGVAAVMADYDNDGDQDIYVVNDGPNRLYRNDGTGRFTDVAVAAGVADAGPGTSAAWGDYDRDGLLDLYVVNYGRCEENMRYYDDVLYHNEGNGTFTDRTALLHATGTTRGLGFQASWIDYDNDGDLDLYLANDYVGPSPRPNVMWRNDGPDPAGAWRFTDVSASTGTGVAINTMGTGIGDYDRDGDLDMALSNMGPMVLLRNGGEGTFTNVTSSAHVARADQRADAMSVTWGMEFRDFNNDGWEDLYVAAGDLLGPGATAPQPNALYVNYGDGSFLDLSAPSGADDAQHSRGVAVADYDRDGRLDLYVVNQTGNPHLYRNVTADPGSHWLEIDTVGTLSNRDGCGTLLVAEIAGQPALRRDVHCGSTSLGSGSEQTVHFGLGSAMRVTRLTVLWPSGIVQTLENIAADQRITLTEPTGPMNQRPIAAADSAATDEDMPVTVDVLANDSDPEGSTLLVSNYDRTTALGGMVGCASPGLCTYTPPANVHGTDSFRYTVADGMRGAATGTVTVTIRPVRDAPMAADDRATTPQYRAVDVHVLHNDADPDGDRLSILSVTAPAHGTARANSDGSVTYTPDPSFKGMDSFEYVVTDGFAGTDTAVVTVVEAGCGEDGPASALIDTHVELLAASGSPELARWLHGVNCSMVVPAEERLPR